MRRRSFLLSALPILGLPIINSCKVFTENELIGQPIPKMNVTATDNGMVEFGNLHTTTLVHFFGIWCMPCMNGLEIWHDQIETLKQIEGLDIFQVHVKPLPAGVESLEIWQHQFKSETHTRMIMDENSQIYDNFKVRGVPNNILIGKNQTCLACANFLEAPGVLNKFIDAARKDLSL